MIEATLPFGYHFRRCGDYAFNDHQSVFINRHFLECGYTALTFYFDTTNPMFHCKDEGLATKIVVFAWPTKKKKYVADESLLTRTMLRQWSQESGVKISNQSIDLSNDLNALVDCVELIISDGIISFNRALCVSGIFYLTGFPLWQLEKTLNLPIGLLIENTFGRQVERGDFVYDELCGSLDVVSDSTPSYLSKLQSLQSLGFLLENEQPVHSVKRINKAGVKDYHLSKSAWYERDMYITGEG